MEPEEGLSPSSTDRVSAVLLDDLNIISGQKT